jgi:hypothetical protein
LGHEGGIIISPRRSLGTGGDCSGTATFSKDDFNVADRIAVSFSVDTRRVGNDGPRCR